MAELDDRKVRGKRSLFALSPDDTNAYVKLSGGIEEGGKTLNSPTSAAWIMLTSFPPSPIQHTRFLVCFRIRRATSAFWVGEHLQATTAESLVAISMDSEQVQKELSGLISLALSVTSGDTNLERFSIDDKTAIQFRLQEPQLVPQDLVRSLGCSRRFE